MPRSDDLSILLIQTSVGVRRDPNLFRFHIGRGLGNDGSGYGSVILDAVQGCIDRGAKVISMSLGGPSKTNSEKRFYKDAWNDGILIIAAAGNSGDTGDLYPASYDHVMSVAAVDKNGTRPGFSQCNSQVEISAPGVDIISTVPLGYAIASGTSMACPHVAGVAAEVWSRFPEVRSCHHIWFNGETILLKQQFVCSEWLPLTCFLCHALRNLVY